MSDATPSFGQDVAPMQTVKPPLFDHLDWASNLELEGVPWYIIALQCRGKLRIQFSGHQSSQHLDLSGLALKATFETLFVAFITSPSPPSSLALLTSVQLAAPQETT